MAVKVRKVPYYAMEPSIFRGTVWKEHLGNRGAVPINTLQKISFDRLAPGATPPPPPLKPTAEQLKAQQAEAARRKMPAGQVKKQQPKETPKPQSEALEAEDQDKIPEFDLQDVPGAMDKIGWPVAAKIARKWFASPKHIYNDDPNSVQPIDDSTITLKWTLRFGSVQKRYDELVSKKIYSYNAAKEAKIKITRQLKTTFVDKGSVDLSFDTSAFIGDERHFHIDWQFQFQDIPTSATLDGLALTDLTAALGNFNLYVAVGRVDVSAERYFQYDNKNKTKAYCIDPVATITHIYVYVKDNYSFNDKGDGKSQYLGHWNKKDMILSYRAALSDLIDGKKIHTQMGSSEITETTVNLNYLPGDPIDKPVDKRPGFGKFLEKNVYYPVYNSSYSEWRERHNRGGDFMIYSRPQLLKLEKKPLQLNWIRYVEHQNQCEEAPQIRGGHRSTSADSCCGHGYSLGQSRLHRLPTL
ncbi:DUF6402 family protein [Burkholderia ambifaria]|uniref:Uncharacterized protein n=1 Tax=Burkholderia ambifaria MEX-5 TaxID=396597 RepID=B1SYH3_9BURK|nr:DUF6402 family protein [Burkholderia ambifaria]EDT43604.1 conserved hypothetical protein [Burkholderia ambifaria MEX-5]